MRFDVLTLFPELFAAFLRTGVTRRAYESGLVDVHLHQVRDYADGLYRRVDDRPFGGGPGMVMLAEPLARCLHAVQAQRGQPAPVLMFAPGGATLSHALLRPWVSGPGAVLVCGRYEGVDQRFVDRYVTHTVSLGDFVLSGGEIAAMAWLDALARLQPGVLGDARSAPDDSFHEGSDGLLDCPHYTRPEVWQGQAVPEVLLSGDHARIARWRRAQSVQLTQQLRPDLIAQARAVGALGSSDEQALGSL